MGDRLDGEIVDAIFGRLVVFFIGKIGEYKIEGESLRLRVRVRGRMCVCRSRIV